MALSAPGLAQHLTSSPEAVVASSGLSETELQPTLGVPDHVYTVGTFDPVDSATYRFTAPLDNVPGADLLVWVALDGIPASTTRFFVEVKTPVDTEFTQVAAIWTNSVAPMDMHDRIVDGGRGPYIDYAHVHAFPVDFGTHDKVTEVRISNAGPAELRLDALEAIHPAVVGARRAVEMRIFRKRGDFAKRFALRFKNIASLDDGVEMSGFTVRHASFPYIDQTDHEILGAVGQFDATPETTAGPDNGPTTMFTDYVWSVPGRGLAPGEIATHVGWNTIDTDVPGDEFLENISFTLRWVDGTQITVDWSDIVGAGFAGQMFSLYEFPPANVSLAQPRPTFYLDVADAPLVPQQPFPPTVPTNVKASAGDDRVLLTWDPSTDDLGLRDYLIERSTGFGFTQIAAILAFSTRHVDLGLPSGTSFFYRIRARDSSGNLSDYSNVVSAMTFGAADTTAPTAPSSLTATPIAARQVDLAWTAATDNVGIVDYVIERSATGGAFAQAGVVLGSATTFADLGAPANTALQYRVRARDAALNSGPYSNVASATTPPDSSTPDGGSDAPDAGQADAGTVTVPPLDLGCRCVNGPADGAGALGWLGLTALALFRRRR